MYAMNIYNLFYKAPAPEGIEERNAHIIGEEWPALRQRSF